MLICRPRCQTSLKPTDNASPFWLEVTVFKGISLKVLKVLGNFCVIMVSLSLANFLSVLQVLAFCVTLFSILSAVRMYVSLHRSCELTWVERGKHGNNFNFQMAITLDVLVHRHHFLPCSNKKRSWVKFGNVLLTCSFTWTKKTSPKTNVSIT